MEKLVIKPTRVTPEVLFFEETSTLQISGRSSPDSALDFYRPLVSRLSSHQSSTQSLHAIFKMDYFNTSSTKCLFDILKTIKRHEATGTRVLIEWYHEDIDDDMREMGEDFADALELPFRYVEY